MSTPGSPSSSQMLDSVPLSDQLTDEEVEHSEFRLNESNVEQHSPHATLHADEEDNGSAYYNGDYQLPIEASDFVAGRVESPSQVVAEQESELSSQDQLRLHEEEEDRSHSAASAPSSNQPSKRVRFHDDVEGGEDSQSQSTTDSTLSTDEPPVMHQESHAALVFPPLPVDSISVEERLRQYELEAIAETRAKNVLSAQLAELDPYSSFVPLPVSPIATASHHALPHATHDPLRPPTVTDSHTSSQLHSTPAAPGVNSGVLSDSADTASSADSVAPVTGTPFDSVPPTPVKQADDTVDPSAVPPTTGAGTQSSPRTKFYHSFPLRQFLLDNINSIPFIKTLHTESWKHQTQEEEIRHLRDLATHLTAKMSEYEESGKKHRMEAVIVASQLRSRDEANKSLAESLAEAQNQLQAFQAQLTTESALEAENRKDLQHRHQMGIVELTDAHQQQMEQMQLQFQQQIDAVQQEKLELESNLRAASQKNHEDLTQSFTEQKHQWSFEKLELEQQIQQMQDDHADEIERLQREHDKKVDHMQKENSEHLATIQRENTAALELIQTHSREQNESWEAATQESQKMIDILKEKINNENAQHKIALESLQRRNAELQAELESASSLLSQRQSELESATREHEELQQQLQIVRSERSDLEQALKNSEVNSQRLNEKVQSLSNENASLHNSLGDIQKSLEEGQQASTAENKETHARYLALQQTHESVVRKSNEIERELMEQIKTLNQQLQSEESKGEKAVELKNQQTTQLQQALKEQKEKLAVAESKSNEEIQQLKQFNSDLQIQLTQSQVECNQLREESNKYQREVHELQEAQSKLQRDLQASQEIAAKSESELAILRSTIEENDRVSKERSDLLTSDHEKTIGTYKTALKSTSQKLYESNTQNETISAQYMQLKTEHNEVRHSLELIKEANQKLKNELLYSNSKPPSPLPHSQSASQEGRLAVQKPVPSNPSNGAAAIAPVTAEPTASSFVPIATESHPPESSSISSNSATVIQALQTELDRANASVVSLQNELLFAQQQSESTSSSVAEFFAQERSVWQQERVKLVAAVKELEAEKSTLQSNLVEKEDQFEHSTAMLSSKNVELQAEVQRLTSDLEKTQTKLQHLTEASQQEADNLKQSVQASSTSEQQLRIKIDDLSTQLSTNNASLAIAASQAKISETRVAELQAKLDESQAALQEVRQAAQVSKASAVAAATEAASQYASREAELRTQLAVANSKIEHLSAVASDNLKATGNTAALREAELQSQLQSTQVQLQLLSSSSNEAKSALASSVQKEADLQQRLSEARTQLHEAQLQHVKSQAELQLQLQQSTAQIQLLTANAASAAASPVPVASPTSSLEPEVTRLNARVLELQNQIEKQQAQAVDAHARRVELEAQVKHLQEEAESARIVVSSSATKQAQLSMLKSQNQLLSESVEKKENDREKLRAENAVLSYRLTQAEAQVGELQKSASSSRLHTPSKEAQPSQQKRSSSSKRQARSQAVDEESKSDSEEFDDFDAESGRTSPSLSLSASASTVSSPSLSLASSRIKQSTSKKKAPPVVEEGRSQQATGASDIPPSPSLIGNSGEHLTQATVSSPIIFASPSLTPATHSVISSPSLPGRELAGLAQMEGELRAEREQLEFLRHELDHWKSEAEVQKTRSNEAQDALAKMRAQQFEESSARIKEKGVADTQTKVTQLELEQKIQSLETDIVLEKKQLAFAQEQLARLRSQNSELLQRMAELEEVASDATGIVSPRFVEDEVGDSGSPDVTRSSDIAVPSSVRKPAASSGHGVELIRLRMELATAQEKQSELQLSTDLLSNSLARMKAGKEEALKSLSILRSELEEAQSASRKELDALRSNVREQESALSSAQSRYRDLEQKLNHVNTEIEATRASATASDALVNSLRKETVQLHEELARVTSQKSLLISEQSASDSNRQREQEALEAQQRQLRAKEQSTVEQLQEEIRRSETRLEALMQNSKKEYRALEDKHMSTMQAAKVEMNMAKEAATRDAASHAESLKSLRAELSSQAAIAGTVPSLKAELDSVKAQLTNSQHNVASLQSHIASIQTTHETERESLEEELATRVQEHTQAVEEARNAKHIARGLEARIAGLEAALESARKSQYQSDALAATHSKALDEARHLIQSLREDLSHRIEIAMYEESLSKLSEAGRTLQLLETKKREADEFIVLLREEISLGQAELKREKEKHEQHVQGPHARVEEAATALASTATALRNQVAALQAELVIIRPLAAEHPSLVEKVDFLQMENEKLTNAEQAKQNLTLALEKAQSFEISFRSLQRDYSELKSLFQTNQSSSEKTIAKLKQENHVHEVENQELISTVQLHSRRLEALKSDLAMAQDQVMEVNRANETHKLKMAGVQSLQLRFESAQERIAMLEKDRAETAKQIHQYDQLRANYSALQQTSLQLTAENDTLSMQMSEKSRTLIAMQKELSQIKEKQRALTDENHNLIHAKELGIAQARNELHETQRVSQLLKEDNNRLLTDRNSAQKQLHELQTSVSMDRKNYQHLQGTLENIQAKLAAVEKEKVVVSDRCEESRIQLAELRERVSTQESMHQAAITRLEADALRERDEALKRLTKELSRNAGDSALVAAAVSSQEKQQLHLQWEQTRNLLAQKELEIASLNASLLAAKQLVQESQASLELLNNRVAGAERISRDAEIQMTSAREKAVSYQQQVEQLINERERMRRRVWENQERADTLRSKAMDSQTADARLTFLSSRLQQIHNQCISAKQQHVQRRKEVGELLAGTFAGMHGDVLQALATIPPSRVE